MNNKPFVSAIVALGNQNQIGHGNNLIWHIPEDMKRLKELTMGHTVIMGRKTYESIPEKFRPLPGRTNIVITRDTAYEALGAIVVHSIDEAFAKACEIEQDEIFVFGGAEIYRQSLDRIDKLYLCLVDSDQPGDSFFPDYSKFNREVYRSEEKEWKGVKYWFVDVTR